MGTKMRNKWHICGRRWQHIVSVFHLLELAEFGQAELVVLLADTWLTLEVNRPSVSMRKITKMTCSITKRAEDVHFLQSWIERHEVGSRSAATNLVYLLNEVRVRTTSSKSDKLMHNHFHLTAIRPIYLCNLPRAHWYHTVPWSIHTTHQRQLWRPRLKPTISHCSSLS